MKLVNYIYKFFFDLFMFLFNNVLINILVFKNRIFDNIFVIFCSWNIFFSRIIISFFIF